MGWTAAEEREIDRSPSQNMEKEEDEETGAIFGYTFEIKSDFDKTEDE